MSWLLFCCRGCCFSPLVVVCVHGWVWGFCFVLFGTESHCVVLAWSSLCRPRWPEWTKIYLPLSRTSRLFDHKTPFNIKINNTGPWVFILCQEFHPLYSSLTKVSAFRHYPGGEKEVGSETIVQVLSRRPSGRQWARCEFSAPPEGQVRNKDKTITLII